jgi:type IV secretion system protein VirB3
MSQDDNSVVIHSSLNRPMLMLGGERNLVLMLGVLAGVFIFSLHALWAAAVGVVLWIVGMYILSRAGAYDHQLSKTGPRSFKYRKFYPAQATPHAPVREIKD